MTAAAMLAEARGDLGMSGRPNAITRSYAKRNGGEFLRAAWCDQAVSEWARASGNAEAVLPAGDRAFTVWHAEDGLRLDRWYDGTADNIRLYALPGAVVFFDWSGGNGIPPIDHVGLVEVNLGDGRVQTIEANTGDAVKRRIRAANVIAGFWNPSYGEALTWTERLMKQLPTLRVGDDNFHVKTLRAGLFARGRVPVAAYGHAAQLRAWLERTDFDAQLGGLVGVHQRAKGLDDDQEVGERTWPTVLLP